MSEQSNLGQSGISPAAYAAGYEQGRSDRDADRPYAVEFDGITLAYEDSYHAGYDDGYMSLPSKVTR